MFLVQSMPMESKGTVVVEDHDSLMNDHATATSLTNRVDIFESGAL